MQVKSLPVTSIAPSPTNPRKRFDKAKLKELTIDIAARGVKQPILVREVPSAISPKGERGYEIILGERRWRACQDAKLTEVPAIVEALTDVQVLELQVIEMDKAQDLTAIEEANAYAALLDTKALNVNDLVQRTGKSRRTIYARLQLRTLCPEVQKALVDGTISHSVGLEIAKVGGDEAQKELLRFAAGNEWEAAASVHSVQEEVKTSFQTAIKKAPFDPEDAELTRAGACSACPKRSGNQPDLFVLKDVGADVCTDRACFKAKIAAHGQNVAAQAKEDGALVLPAAEAKKIFKYGRDDPAHNSGFARPEDPCWDLEGTPYKKALTKKELPTPVVALHPDTGAPITLYAKKDLTKALKDKGLLSKKGKAPRSARQSKADATVRFEGAVHRQWVKDLSHEAEGSVPGGVVFWQLLATGVLAEVWHDKVRPAAENRELLDVPKGKEKPDPVEALEKWIAQAKAGELRGLVVELLTCGTSYRQGYEPLKRWASLYEVPKPTRSVASYLAGVEKKRATTATRAKARVRKKAAKK
jgi:ParB/RepB/Spo0J family partition protein